MNNDQLSLVYCSFYERLRSPDEVIAAMRLDVALSDRGVPAGMGPQQYLAVQIFPSIYDAPSGVVPLPGPDERTIGAHIVVLIGFKDEHLFFINNWGPEWGTNGAGCLSLDYLNRFQLEAWSTRWLTGTRLDVFPGPEDDLGPSNERLSKLFEYQLDSPEDTNFFTIHRGTVVDVLGRWLVGISDGSAWLQCIAMLHETKGEPLIVGWMHIRGTPAGADVEELFVWPPYRERGIGTALASQALLAATATSWRRCRWTWHELEADTMVRQRSQLKPRIPGWLKHLLSNPDGAVTSEERLLDLLVRLAKLQAPDGVRLLRDTVVNSAVVDCVVDAVPNPTYGVVVSDHGGDGG